MVVYDVRDRKSYDMTRDWIAQIKYVSQNFKSTFLNFQFMYAIIIIFFFLELKNAYCPFIIVGNCCDEIDHRVVRYEEGENLAKEFNVQYLECSAKTSYNVDMVFETAITRALLSTGFEAEHSRMIYEIKQLDLAKLRASVAKLPSIGVLKYCGQVKQ